MNWPTTRVKCFLHTSDKINSSQRSETQILPHTLSLSAVKWTNLFILELNQLSKLMYFPMTKIVFLNHLILCIQVHHLPWLMQCWFSCDLNSKSSSAASFSPRQVWASVPSQESPAVWPGMWMFPFRSKQPRGRTSPSPPHTVAIEGWVRAALFTAFDGGCSLEPLQEAH